MTMDDWVFAVQYIKDWCVGATERLTKNLKTFPQVDECNWDHLSQKL